MAQKRVMIFAAPDFEDLELWYPLLRLREAGAEVTVAGLGERTYLGKHGLPVQTDGDIEGYDPADFDVLVVPGGWAPDRLRRYEAVLDFVRAMHSAGKTIAAICHAGWVLASAEIVEGRTVTCVRAIRDDMVHAGARYVDRAVVVDGNLVTSRVPADLPDFCRAIIETAQI
jgi:protease I